MITAAGDQASQHMLFLLHILQFNNISYNYTLLQAVMSEARSELFFGGGGGSVAVLHPNALPIFKMRWSFYRSN